MKLFVFAAVLAVAAAAPSDSAYEEDIVEILRQNIDHNDDHSYQQSFETENGISVSEFGQTEDDDSYSTYEAPAEEEEEEEEEDEEEVRASYEPQYERVIVGYRPRYN
ncbi:voltage-dependent L-type calcium channel subunit alpha-1D-like [Pollicipes pollicipes]|uniref:voltage-dependent L-type calcium channel subunit alpha-1D-like n=1 Tax=Pollicipes pollicipes TaxID=41117 RepID=UPI001884C781|nr:voltage-dependent L-type calcium channel subunit alpha-1D-like [Pollicipes pollicipes]